MRRRISSRRGSFPCRFVCSICRRERPRTRQYARWLYRKSWLSYSARLPSRRCALMDSASFFWDALTAAIFVLRSATVSSVKGEVKRVVSLGEGSSCLATYVMIFSSSQLVVCAGQVRPFITKPM